jgi:hypothetical protein
MKRAFSISVATALGLLAGVSAASAQATISRETTTTTTTTSPGRMTLAPEVRTRVHQYVVAHRQPSVRIQDRVAVGVVLPSDAQFYAFDGVDGVGPYRYAYVNDAPVLVDPGSRRVIEVIE